MIAFQLKTTWRFQVFLSTADMSCMIGCGSNESAVHLFIHCTFSANMWALVWNWLGISFVHAGELRHHFIQFSKMAGIPLYSHLFFRIIWFVTVWTIWKERNNRVFQNTVSNPLNIIEKIKLNSFLWLKSKQVDFVYSYHDWWKHPIPSMSVIL